jgi:uncharacterized membrane protein YedE/YeeE
VLQRASGVFGVPSFLDFILCRKIRCPSLFWIYFPYLVAGAITLIFGAGWLVFRSDGGRACAEIPAGFLSFPSTLFYSSCALSCFWSPAVRPWTLLLGAAIG